MISFRVSGSKIYCQVSKVCVFPVISRNYIVELAVFLFYAIFNFLLFLKHIIIQHYNYILTSCLVQCFLYFWFSYNIKIKFKKMFEKYAVICCYTFALVQCDMEPSHSHVKFTLYISIRMLFYFKMFMHWFMMIMMLL